MHPKKISFLYFLLFCSSLQGLFAQELLLDRLVEDRFLYCDDLVEVCPNPEQIANLLLTYELYSGNTKAYIGGGYYQLFKERLDKTFAVGGLQGLWLEGNFKTLPPEVSKMEKLQKLVIEYDSIAEIPNSVSRLLNLETLYLENTRLLPVGISHFKKLKVLKIRAPRITQFSKDIGELQELNTLVVLENKMAEMHPILGNLNNLEILYWSGGYITKIPATVGKLKKLKELYLPSNQITHLPAEIGNLEGLEILNLFANRLKDLPIQITQLKNLKRLDLRGNAFENLQITPELYAFFLRLNNGNNEVIGFLMDKFRMQAEITYERTELARARAEREEALQKARANEAEAKHKDEEARANKAEAMQQAEQSKRIEEQLKRQQSERETLLAKQKTSIAESELLKSENAKKNAQLLAKESELQTQQAERNMYFLILGLVFLLVVGAMILRTLRRERLVNAQLEAQKQEIEAQKAKADTLLLNILPADIAQELKEKGFTEVKYFDSASVLFADVQGFSALAKEISPQELIKELDLCFSAFDEIAGKYRLERIKTIGDNYMCAGGVPNTNLTHAYDITLAALEMQRWMAQQASLREAVGKKYWKIRIGIHTGDLVAGVIGKTKFAYDLWGDTVNTASRMETAGETGKVNISESTYNIIKDDFICTPRGEIEAKNIGLIHAYFVDAIC